MWNRFVVSLSDDMREKTIGQNLFFEDLMEVIGTDFEFGISVRKS